MKRSQQIMVNLDAYMAIAKVDRDFVGTQNYMGLAYYWNHEYRHYLRDATYKQRVTVHDALLKHGLALDGISNLHEQIIKQKTKKRRNV
jgi:hypothetical protein